MMTNVDYSICGTQGEIFEYAVRNGYEFKSFVKAYMESEFCERAFDTDYSRFQFAEDIECWDFFYPECKGLLTKYADGKTFDPDVAYWIGFTYRQIYIESGIMSKDIINLLGVETMCDYYPGLHTVDEDMAYDIIKENVISKYGEEVFACRQEEEK